jgi:formylmethanofuran dehydrogenase subunit E
MDNDYMDIDNTIWTAKCYRCSVVVYEEDATRWGGTWTCRDCKQDLDKYYNL